MYDNYNSLLKYFSLIYYFLTNVCTESKDGIQTLPIPPHSSLIVSPKGMSYMQKLMLSITHVLANQVILYRL